MKITRSRKSHISDWWWTIDKVQLGSIVLLIIIGIVLNLAASPPIAEKLSLNQYYFVKRQFLFFILGVFVMFFFSFLNLRNLRRLCLVIFITSLITIFFLNIFGTPIKGATRWLDLGIISVQPSEFAKPTFIVLISWFLSESIVKTVPSKIISLLLYSLFAFGLILQPDIGQTILITLAASIIYFISGMPLIVGFIIFILSLIGIGLSYLYVDHFYQRLNIFFNPSLGDTYQIDTAYNAILQGGWFGVGPGEGVIKNILPDAHTDFIFAVAAEEFGLISCFIIISLFAFIVYRGLSRSLKQEDLFAKIATIGLTSLICIQVGINIAVNLGIVPTKGMTLPFISYGGSSALSIAMTFGLILAFTRQKNNSFIYSSRKLNFQN
ncbi:MAG: cell division protein FtsW [Rhodobiaceae bacterium]|nr:cell division protein FtsW [Rhodobiaceae bacterium]|tara:strand:- start:67727 stop:68869 length:1143 start_codon:yes stop_codon:yes gene_type:complete